jgi:serine/threonine protein kinase/tetratricopeptide (TPR) repeat protein
MSEETLLHQALALPPAQRAAFLDQVCAGQPALRAAVAALLQAHEAPANVLDEPPAGLPQTGPYTPPDLVVNPVGSPAPGSVFACRFKLREKLGEGGMGVVFVADQLEPVQRRVALKIIKPGLDSSRVLARFEQERQALALMDHPHIAKVLDAGVSEAGQPYFVMELIKGVPFTRYCDDARLTPRQRLELFIPVCQAVQHAHQKGVIHRDLKPSNVLVGLYDGKPIPKVIDFGVAKATGPRLSQDSVYTEVGTLIGTLEYMAPEQAQLNNLDIDTRSDIYALGVILYELLTGSVPFSRKELKAAAFDEVVRILKEVEPPKPSTRLSGSGSLPSIAAVRQTDPRKLTKLVRGDLDWIVMKCLEKERGRRYETANGLALELQRYLTEEPVLAGPPGATYRLRKFVRRNKGPMAAAALVLGVLLAGIVGTSWGLLWANDARKAETEQRAAAQRSETDALVAAAKASQARLAEAHQRGLAEASAQQAREAAAAAEKARQLAEAERDKAAQARDRTRQVLDQMTSELTEDSLATQNELSTEQKRFLSEVLTYYREFAGEKADDPQTRARAAKAAYRVGLIQARLGRREEAAAAIGQARDEFAKLAAEFPAPATFREELATCHFQLGVLLRHLGKHGEARRACEAAMALWEKLAAAFPAEAPYRQKIAWSHNSQGNLLKDLAKFTAALEANRRAAGMQAALVADFPAEPAYRYDLAKSHNNAGLLLRELGRMDEALKSVQEAVNLQDKLAAEFPGKPVYRKELATYYLNLATVLADLGKPGAALEANRAAVAVNEKLAAEFPAEATIRHNLASSHNNLGIGLDKLGKSGEALAAFRAALALWEKLTAELPTVPHYRQCLAIAHNNLGQQFAQMGKGAEAGAAFRAAVAVQEKLAVDFPAVPGYRFELAKIHARFGRLLRDSGKPPEALESYRAAQALCEKLVGEFPAAPSYRAEVASCHEQIGYVLLQWGKRAEGLSAYWTALALNEKLAAEFPAETSYRHKLGGCHYSLGFQLSKLGDRVEAVAAFQAALAVQEKLVADFPARPAYRQELADSHNALGTEFRDLGKPEEGLTAYRAALTLRQKLAADFPAVPAYQLDLGGCYCNVGHGLRDLGKAEESLDWFAKAIATLASLAAKAPKGNTARLYLRNSHWGKAQSLVALDRHAEALADWDKAVALSDAKVPGQLGMGRAMSRIRAGKVEEALADAGELAKLKGWSATSLYNLACIYSLASAKDRAKQDEHAQRAVALLRQAVQAGYKNVPHIKKDPDLDPLRQRPDFQTLLAELDKGKEPGP